MTDDIESGLLAQCDFSPEEIEEAYNVNSENAVFGIGHEYDSDEQRVWVLQVAGDNDGLRAALYCEFKCEEWFEGRRLTNSEIASLLVMFYGYQPIQRPDCYILIDIHDQRERYCGWVYQALMGDASLHRDGTA